LWSVLPRTRTIVGVGQNRLTVVGTSKQQAYERVERSNSCRWAGTIGVMTEMAIAALEATVVGTAMPTVIASLGGIAHYSWVFSAYIVTSTVTVPVWGKLSDLYGRRLLY